MATYNIDTETGHQLCAGLPEYTAYRTVQDMPNNTNTADDFIRTYSIKNSNGLSGGDWSRLYNTREQAAAAIARAYGWDAAAVAIGPEMIDEVGDDGEEEIAWCVYESQEDCDSDDTGAHAPRIVRS